MDFRRAEAPDCPELRRSLVADHNGISTGGIKILRPFFQV